MMFGGLAILGVVGYLIWDRMQREQEAPGAKKDRALEVLRERYAAGEISREEYEERRRALEGG